MDRITAARSVPEALLLLRARSGLTQEELARRTGLNERTIGNYETGKTKHRREVELARIVAALADALREDRDSLWSELMGLSGVDLSDLEVEADVIGEQRTEGRGRDERTTGG
jgi:transcriptional regulator with XRE-family HTH domain